MKHFIDYYQVLQLRRAATPDEIKHSYRALAVKHHPDMGGDVIRMAQLNEAYEILSRLDYKESYDRIYDSLHASLGKRPHASTSFASGSTYRRTTKTAADKEFDHLVKMYIRAKQVAKDNVMRGFLWFAVGAIIAVSGNAFDPEGGYIIFAFSPIIIGVTRMVRALRWYFNPGILVRQALNPNMRERMLWSSYVRPSFKLAIYIGGAVLVTIWIISSVVVEITSPTTPTPGVMQTTEAAEYPTGPTSCTPAQTNTMPLMHVGSAGTEAPRC